MHAESCRVSPANHTVVAEHPEGVHVPEAGGPFHIITDGVLEDLLQRGLPDRLLLACRPLREEQLFVQVWH